jgi:hypothetical protein
MEYRFTMTFRLIALTIVSLLILLGLLFALGFELGQQWRTQQANPQDQAVNAILRSSWISNPAPLAAAAATLVAPAAVEPANPPSAGLGAAPR